MKILIIKFAALGDVLRTISLVPAIKHRWPNSKITFFTKKEALPLFNNFNDIDRVLTYDKKTLKFLKKEYFDLVINLEEGYEACIFASKIRKKELKGFYFDKGKIKPTPSAKEWFNMSSLGRKTPKIKGMYRNDYLKKKNTKTWQQLMSDIIGIDASGCSLNYKLNPRQKKFALDFARRYNINNDDLVIGLNTGAGQRWPAKNLSIEKTAKLAEMLYKKLNAKIILFGGPNEIERNNDIIARSKVPIINSGCGNDLFEFPALISLCHLFITSDTLGMHLAIALKRKIIAFFGPTSASEIELFGLGEKIIAKHSCYCCYKSDCKADEAYSIKEIFNVAKDIINFKITIVVTAFKEPRLENTLKSILKQKIKYPYKLLVAVPDKDSIELVKKYSKKYKQVELFKDPGKGKSFALNLIFDKLRKEDSEIIILTDGDVVLKKDAINAIANTFKDPSVGCATGRVVSMNPRDDKLGFWSHLLADAGAHRMRKELDLKGRFLECSGYLFAFRNNGVINKIPLDVAEDAIIPYYFWKKGYKIRYVEKAIVYVKNPTNFEDWLKQRKRTAKAHETLVKYAPDFPRVKSFRNEAIRVFWALQYPRNLREFIWTIQLIYARLYMWLAVFYETFIKKEHYQDAWERVESTKV